jgi:hypothetical protein
MAVTEYPVRSRDVSYTPWTTRSTGRATAAPVSRRGSRVRGTPTRVA